MLYSYCYHCRLPCLIVTFYLVFLLLSALFRYCLVFCFIVAICVADKVDLSRKLIIFVSIIQTKLYKQEG